MERVYFISDAHLGGHGNELEARKSRRLVSFLKNLEHKADFLYIVGDLFDYWFEYTYAVPRINIRVLSALLHLVETGTQVCYLLGNHDLWHLSYLEREIGVRIYREPADVSHNDLRLLVAHGDGLTDNEWKMRLLKRVMNGRLNNKLYRWLHPDLGMPLMRYVSGRSKKKDLPRPLDPYREYAKTKFSEGFDALIMGHTHNPTFEEYEKKYFINLGDWITNFTYVELCTAVPVFKRWEREF